MFVKLYVSNRKIVETVSFRCILTFISHSLCLLLEWVGMFTLSIAKLLTFFACFKPICVFDLCQLLVQAYEVQKDITVISEND